jgi:hypothetical protein
VLDHLGLPKAHFGLRYPLDLVGLLERAPERVASVVLQGATGRPEPFAPVAAHTLWLLGDAGPSGQMRARLEALPHVVVHGIKNYPEFLWSDTAVDHAEEMASTMLHPYEVVPYVWKMAQRLASRYTAACLSCIALFLSIDGLYRCLLSGVVVCPSTRFSVNRTTSMSRSRSRTIGAW